MVTKTTQVFHTSPRFLNLIYNKMQRDGDMMKKVFCLLFVICMLPFTYAISDGGFAADTVRINEAAASVVILEQKDTEDNVTARASGFAAIMPNLVITSASFIQLGTSISAVTDEGETLNVSGILGCNTDSDVAILVLEDVDKLTPLELNASKRILRGSDCVVIGAQGKNISVSIGNMSGFFEDGGINLIQFTAPLSVGSGGSPLFDENGEVAGVTTGSYVDGTGVVQNLNFAVGISEALALYEIVKDDEVAPLFDWEITDVGTKRYTDPELPMEFYIQNNAYGYATEIYLFKLGSSMGRSRITERLNFGETATIKVSREEYESEDFWQIKITQDNWSAYNYLSIPYPISYLLGKTFVISKYSASADSVSMLFEEVEKTPVERRHMAEGKDLKTLYALPSNCIMIKNDTDYTMLEFSFANMSYSNFLSTYGANNMLYSGHKIAVFLPDKYLTGVDTYDLRIILRIDRNNKPTYTWKIKAEDLLGKTLHFYKDENGKVTFESE